MHSVVALRFMLRPFLPDCQRSIELQRMVMTEKMAGTSSSYPDVPKASAWLEGSWKQAVQGRTVWISPALSLEEVEDLIK